MLHELIVDAGNDCYAGWKVFQVLEAIRRNTPGVKVPIEPYDSYIKIRKRKPIELLVRLRFAWKEGLKCVALLKSYDDMITGKVRE